MRLQLSFGSLATVLFVLSLLFFIAPADSRANDILSPDCVVDLALCGDIPRTEGHLSLSAATSSYSTPAPYWVLSDSHSLSDMTPYAASASGSFTTAFSGLHMTLSATASLFCGHGEASCCPGPDCYAGSAGAGGYMEMVDYFETGSSVPKGASMQVTYTLDASGNGTSDRQSFVMLDSDLELDGNDFGLACSAGRHFVNLGDPIATVCTESIPVDPNEIVTMLLTVNGSVSASGDTNSYLNALNTAKITSVLLVDANGNSLDLPLYDASGYNYNAAAVVPPVSPASTPEPSSLVLLGSVAIGMAGLRCRVLHR